MRPFAPRSALGGVCCVRSRRWMPSLTRLKGKIILHKIRFAFLPFIPVILLEAAYRYVRGRSFFTGWKLAVGLVIPIITVFLAWTSGGIPSSDAIFPFARMCVFPRWASPMVRGSLSTMSTPTRLGSMRSRSWRGSLCNRMGGSAGQISRCCCAELCRCLPTCFSRSRPRQILTMRRSSFSSAVWSCSGFSSAINSMTLLLSPARCWSSS